VRRRSEGRTLDDLDPPAWGSAPSGATRLVQRCHKLRQKPIDSYSTDDLRVMIGQQIGLSHLVPIAIRRLSDNPLAAGDFYRGDLLNAVLSVDAAYWHQHRDEYREVRELLDDVMFFVEETRDDVQKFCQLIP
jgi:hypothetical protein